VPPVIRHPKYDAAVAARLGQLRTAINDDRERATSALKVAIAKLDALRSRCDAPVLRSLSAEYAVCLHALAAVDAAQADDNLIDLLEHIQNRLRSGLDALAGLSTQPMQRTPAEDGHGGIDD